MIRNWEKYPLVIGGAQRAEFTGDAAARNILASRLSRVYHWEWLTAPPREVDPPDPHVAFATNLRKCPRTTGSIHGQFGGVHEWKCRMGARDIQSVDDLIFNRTRYYYFRSTLSSLLYVTQLSRDNVVAHFRARSIKLEEGETSWTMRLWQDCGPCIRV